MKKKSNQKLRQKSKVKDLLSVHHNKLSFK